MEFCDVFPHSTTKFVRWSGKGSYFALVFENKIVVRETESSAIAYLSKGSNIAEIKKFEWSNDETKFAFYVPKNGLLKVVDLAESTTDNVIAKLENEMGIESLLWSPDSQNLVLLDDCGIKTTIINLRNGQLFHIKNPKGPTCMAFSPDSRFFAMIQRKNVGEECINIFETMNWRQVKVRILKEKRSILISNVFRHLE